MVEQMKTDAILSKAETRVALCYVFGLIGKEAAAVLSVSYNTIIRHTQNIYDKTGIPRSINSIVSWWYRMNYDIDLGVELKTGESLGMVMKEFGRRIGAMCLLILFCAYTFSNGDFERAARRTRRGRENEVEYLIEG